MADALSTVGIGQHGADRLPSVIINSYNLELKDEDGFIGDRASKGAFHAILEGWRRPLKKAGDDPFGNKSSEEISKKELDQILAGDDAEAAALVLGTVERFAQELSAVTQRFLKTKGWKGDGGDRRWWRLSPQSHRRGCDCARRPDLEGQG